MCWTGWRDAGRRAGGGQRPLLRRPAGGPPRARARDLQIVISDERAELLETGGGLKKAAAAAGRRPDLRGQYRQRLDRAGADALDDAGARLGPGTHGRLPAAGARARARSASRAAATSSCDDDGRLTFRGDAAPARPSPTWASHITKPQVARRRARRRLLAHRRSGGGWRPRAGCTARVLDGFWMHVGDPAGARRGRGQAERARR